ncbi:cell division protein ZapD [mine drainage metagenome]|uniref:Cell division protein ZapD n=1 Tax=mine drainage metagenome TaxID=410659 RepID=A0A1J5QWH7_9ZZZZ
MSSYDYPFNERIRTLLRLEDLFVKTQHYLRGDHEFNHHTALIGIFQILDVIDRAELKTDMLQELDRQKIVMESLRGNPAIAEAILNQVLDEIEKTARLLRLNTGRIGQSLRDDDWLMSIKQRAGIPGGVCEFDVPSYHYWLALPETQRKQDLENWLVPLTPLYDGLRIILHILRGSGSPTSLVARQGAYQQMLGGAKPAQMLRVKVDDSLACFPEVSANKYAINIRFNMLEPGQKPHQCDRDIPFKLTLCNL